MRLGSVDGPVGGGSELPSHRAVGRDSLWQTSLIRSSSSDLRRLCRRGTSPLEVRIGGLFLDRDGSSFWTARDHGRTSLETSSNETVSFLFACRREGFRSFRSLRPQSFVRCSLEKSLAAFDLQTLRSFVAVDLCSGHSSQPALTT
jgi:hypothetical protein